eukprot:TRINITY_DN3165_c0_g1_i5.p1 TRINITY_DN3165_c0_g1~~TRINITY_DN3165_c0_g1_i5.p1  ORF type:complete len:588 (-),score=112.49 TRINITY_DN3165_c0_g1_i5:36-1799(-)
MCIRDRVSTQSTGIKGAAMAWQAMPWWAAILLSAACAEVMQLEQDAAAGCGGTKPFLEGKECVSICSPGAAPDSGKKCKACAPPTPYADQLRGCVSKCGLGMLPDIANDCTGESTGGTGSFVCDGEGCHGIYVLPRAGYASGSTSSSVAELGEVPFNKLFQNLQHQVKTEAEFAATLPQPAVDVPKLGASHDSQSRLAVAGHTPKVLGESKARFVHRAVLDLNRKLRLPTQRQHPEHVGSQQVALSQPAVMMREHPKKTDSARGAVLTSASQEIASNIKQLQRRIDGLKQERRKTKSMASTTLTLGSIGRQADRAKEAAQVRLHQAGVRMRAANEEAAKSEAELRAGRERLMRMPGGSLSTELGHAAIQDSTKAAHQLRIENGPRQHGSESTQDAFQKMTASLARHAGGRIHSEPSSSDLSDDARPMLKHDDALNQAIEAASKGDLSAFERAASGFAGQIESSPSFLQESVGADPTIDIPRAKADLRRMRREIRRNLKVLHRRQSSQHQAHQTAQAMHSEEVLRTNATALRKKKELALASQRMHDFIHLSLIHISEPTRLLSISYAVFCLKKKKKNRLISHYKSDDN